MFDSLGDYALKYARHGWAVHALKPRQKIPATPHGCKDASTDEDTVRAMWGDQPYNIGLATGLASGIFVFDVDSAPPKDGGLTGPDALSELVAEHGPLPATMTVRTGSGAHYYFRMPVGVELNNRARITVRGQRTGLDVRADGGYVVAPPSRHASGRHYQWEVAPGTVPPADTTPNSSQRLNRLLAKTPIRASVCDGIRMRNAGYRANGVLLTSIETGHCRREF